MSNSSSHTKGGFFPGMIRRLRGLGFSSVFKKMCVSAPQERSDPTVVENVDDCILLEDGYFFVVNSESIATIESSGGYMSIHSLDSPERPRFLYDDYENTILLNTGKNSVISVNPRTKTYETKYIRRDGFLAVGVNSSVVVLSGNESGENLEFLLLNKTTGKEFIHITLPKPDPYPEREKYSYGVNDRYLYIHDGSRILRLVLPIACNELLPPTIMVPVVLNEHFTVEPGDSVYIVGHPSERKSPQIIVRDKASIRIHDITGKLLKQTAEPRASTHHRFYRYTSRGSVLSHVHNKEKRRLIIYDVSAQSSFKNWF